MIRTSDLIPTGERKSPEELYRIRAGEMLTKRLDGWHTRDIAALYKISTRMVNQSIGEIPAEAKAMIVTDRDRMGSRWIERIALGKREGPPAPVIRPMSFDARELKRRAFSRPAQDMICEMTRRLDQGETVDQVALSFGTKPQVVRRAVWEHWTRGLKRASQRRKDLRLRAAGPAAQDISGATGPAGSG